MGGDEEEPAIERVLGIENLAEDPAAFAASVRPRLDAMLRTATAILGDEQDALDAVQETLVDAWRGLPSLRDPTRYDAWLARILVNRCRMLLRTRRRRRLRQIQVALDPADASFVDGRRDVGTELAERDALDRAFDRLRADDRSLIVLHYLEGRSLAELGDVFDVPEGTIKSRLWSARQALTRALEKERR